MKYVKSAGGIVLNLSNECVVVVNQRNLSWSLPKGHIEEGESILEAAQREIYEESGISQLEYIADLGSYQRHKIDITGGDDTTEEKTIYMFLFKTTQSELSPIDPENPEARWVHKNDVPYLLTHRKDKEFFLSILNKYL